MKTQKIINVLSISLLVISALSISMVGFMAFKNPQSVMDLVNVQLNNNDAYSSIRGVYGGVSLTIVLLLIYFIIYDKILGMAFISVLWGSYALSRITTIMIEGSLGDFGNQWLKIESILCIISVSLLIAGLKQGKNKIFGA